MIVGRPVLTQPTCTTYSICYTEKHLFGQKLEQAEPKPKSEPAGPAGLAGQAGWGQMARLADLGPEKAGALFYRGRQTVRKLGESEF